MLDTFDILDILDIPPQGTMYHGSMLIKYEMVSISVLVALFSLTHILETTSEVFENLKQFRLIFRKN